MAQKNTKFSIDSAELSIGSIGSRFGGIDFAGCISEVSIFAYEKSADEIAQFDCSEEVVYSESYCAKSSDHNCDGTTCKELFRQNGNSLEECLSLCKGRAGCQFVSYTASTYGDCLLYDECPSSRQYGDGTEGTVTYRVCKSDCWQTASVGDDLARGQWDGTGATSFKQCKAKAESAGVQYFAWTGQVYGGYCKVLKPSVTVPNLSTNQGYGYKLWQNTCIEPNPTEGATIIPTEEVSINPTEEVPIQSTEGPTWSTQRCVLEECGCNHQGEAWCDDSNAWMASEWCHVSTSNCAACHGLWCGTNRRLLQGY